MPRQNAPSLSRSDRMQKLKAGQPKTITKGKRGVEIAERQFRLPRSHKQDKSVFSPLLCAYKRGWPAGDKLPTGRNPRRPNAGLRFGKRSASETGFFLARYRAENRCRLIGRHTCTASLATRPNLSQACGASGRKQDGASPCTKACGHCLFSA